MNRVIDKKKEAGFCPTSFFYLLLLLCFVDLDLLGKDARLYVGPDAHGVDGAGFFYLQRILVEGR